MKAKNLYYLMALCAGSFALAPTASAQDVVVEENAVSVTEFTCDNSNKYSQSWRDNWFLQLGAGVDQPFVERGTKGAKAPGALVNRHNMTAVYNVGVGHWFSPYMGFRLNALGGALHWNTPTAPGNGWSKAKHANLNLEFMWDMCNSIAGVNPDRPVSVIPFIGLGGDYTWDINAVSANIQGNHGIKNSSWTLPVTAGFQLRFRLCKYVDFFAEARAGFYPDNWLGYAGGRPLEANAEVLGGLNINFGGRKWNSYNQCEDMATIAQLNNDVNNLRAENLAAAQTIAALQSQLPCPEPVVQKDCANAPLMTTVRFTINSDKIMPTEEVNVYNMAEWLKANPDEKVVIVGYADRDTGTSEYNMQLSKKRADAVANALINQYGIDSSRLIVKYDGSDQQPYSTNDWNRIVIFTQK
ncbi:MAG: OmpA family protein [Muribaculaceae bacterium]|nr:OmpA family protein [Bacteroides sp.]MDE6226718.1 OmpA family protein [Muribaculaceae bacterium]